MKEKTKIGHTTKNYKNEHTTDKKNVTITLHGSPENLLRSSHQLLGEISFADPENQLIVFDPVNL